MFQNALIRKFSRFLASLVKSSRLWLLWLAAAAVILWYYLTDPDGGAETLARLQWQAWLVVNAGPAYLYRKTLIPGDSKTAWEEVKKGNVAAGIWAAGVAILTGLLILAFASMARAGECPDKALAHLPTLQSEIQTYWQDAPCRAVFAGQVEQETCPSLTSKKCWNPRTELKTAREYGFGLGQLTKTARFDNFAEARKLHPTLRDWQWQDRYDAARQLRTMLLMDRGNYRRLPFVENARERLAMALAGYNGGMGGLLSDRRVCASVPGCNPDIWFGHVELHSLKAKRAAKGYGKSFFEINREYPRNIFGFRRQHYAAWFGEV